MKQLCFTMRDIFPSVSCKFLYCIICLIREDSLIEGNQLKMFEVCYVECTLHEHKGLQNVIFFIVGNKRQQSKPYKLCSWKTVSSDLWTDNVCRQISEQMFAPKGGLCLCMPQRKNQSELLTSNWNKLYLVHSYWLKDIDIIFKTYDCFQLGLTWCRRSSL